METAAQRARDEWLALRCQLGEAAAFDELVQVEQAKAESTDEAGDSPDFGPDDVAAVHRALDELELAHREVLVLQFLEDMSIAEIASVLDCPPGTIKSRLHYAKRALRGVVDRGGYGTH